MYLGKARRANNTGSAAQDFCEPGQGEGAMQDDGRPVCRDRRGYYPRGDKIPRDGVGQHGGENRLQCVAEEVFFLPKFAPSFQAGKRSKDFLAAPAQLTSELDDDKWMLLGAIQASR